jgi:hypothetical protein
LQGVAMEFAAANSVQTGCKLYDISISNGV